MAALEALESSAFAADFPALATSAIRRLAQAEGLSFPDLPPIPGGLSELTFDEVVAIELSRLFLTYGRFDETVALMEGIDRPSARNNLALARFARGEITEALAAVEANWRQDTRNLFALHHVVRLRLWSGGRESAFELSDALRDTQPTRAEDAYGKMFGLLPLGAHDETIEAWRTLRDADIWEEGSAVESSMCAHFAG